MCESKIVCDRAIIQTREDLERVKSDDSVPEQEEFLRCQLTSKPTHQPGEDQM